LKLATDGDETKLFESEFQWLITRLLLVRKQLIGWKSNVTATTKQ